LGTEWLALADSLLLLKLILRRRRLALRGLAWRRLVLALVSVFALSSLRSRLVFRWIFGRNLVRFGLRHLCLCAWGSLGCWWAWRSLGWLCDWSCLDRLGVRSNLIGWGCLRAVGGSLCGLVLFWLLLLWLLLLLNNLLFDMVSQQGRPCS